MANDGGSPWRFQCLCGVRHEDFFESIKRGKGEADQVAENSLFKLVSGFEYETEKVFQTGVRMKTTVFQPPDPGSVKF